ncbi:hypothetical protein NMY22_g14156 [Coprinellus aureogranulatus]|nr:hypothetical protein NMY22_g14156 [Coprinellus aureogranulatus]
MSNPRPRAPLPVNRSFSDSLYRSFSQTLNNNPASLEASNSMASSGNSSFFRRIASSQESILPDGGLARLQQKINEMREYYSDEGNISSSPFSDSRSPASSLSSDSARSHGSASSVSSTTSHSRSSAPSLDVDFFADIALAPTRDFSTKDKVIIL